MAAAPRPSLTNYHRDSSRRKSGEKVKVKGKLIVVKIVPIGKQYRRRVSDHLTLARPQGEWLPPQSGMNEGSQT